MLHCFRTVQHKLGCRIGYFGLYGFDFLVDENMKVRDNIHVSAFNDGTVTMSELRWFIFSLGCTDRSG